jgi:hypothetical protein
LCGIDEPANFIFREIAQPRLIDLTERLASPPCGVRRDFAIIESLIEAGSQDVLHPVRRGSAGSDTVRVGFAVFGLPSEVGEPFGEGILGQVPSIEPSAGTICKADLPRASARDFAPLVLVARNMRPLPSRQSEGLLPTLAPCASPPVNALPVAPGNSSRRLCHLPAHYHRRGDRFRNIFPVDINARDPSSAGSIAPVLETEILIELWPTIRHCGWPQLGARGRRFDFFGVYRSHFFFCSNLI